VWVDDVPLTALPALRRLGAIMVERVFRGLRDGAVAAPGALTDLYGLIVDDDEDMRGLMAMVLETNGVQTRCTGSCAEALAVFARERPDVLVADLGLPDEDGYALIRRIRALPPADGGRVPAVAFTGLVGTERGAVAAGYQRCLTKPVELDVILATIAELGGRATG
jgi:CheY-like chemotaxis protein